MVSVFCIQVAAHFLLQLKYSCTGIFTNAFINRNFNLPSFEGYIWQSFFTVSSQSTPPLLPSVDQGPNMYLHSGFNAVFTKFKSDSSQSNAGNQEPI